MFLEYLMNIKEVLLGMFTFSIWVFIVSLFIAWARNEKHMYAISFSVFIAMFICTAVIQYKFIYPKELTKEQFNTFKMIDAKEKIKLIEGDMTDEGHLIYSYLSSFTKEESELIQDKIREALIDDKLVNGEFIIIQSIAHDIALEKEEHYIESKKEQEKRNTKNDINDYIKNRIVTK